MKGIASLVQNVAQNVADRLQQPHQLDLTYITPRIMAMSECAAAPIPTYDDDGRSELVFPPSAAATTTTSQQQQPLKKGNSPVNLSTFLQNRKHEGHELILSLSDTPPDDRSLLLLRRQILHIPWASPGKERSETPSLPQLLDVCYTIHAHLQLSPENVIIVSCFNGKTRSAIVVACYLYFSGHVETPLEAFSLFLSKRCPQLVSNDLTQHIPPSLGQFFSNFQNVLALGDFSNPKPLLLRAVALQGVPVDDKPCIDIWDAQQRHVYSSHNAKMDDSQWAEEEGFYRVNCVLEGDFCLLCRFGGVYADGDGNKRDGYDPSKVLFRYANSAGFLSSGTWELPKQKVDMMRRYEASFEEDDFLLTLILESYWDVAPQQRVPALMKEDSKLLPPILHGHAAMERGWQLMTQYHACRPSEKEDVARLKTIFPEVQHFPPHICTVALQLTNLDLQGARTLLLEGPMKEWWNATSTENEAMQVDDPYDNDVTLEDWPATNDADHSNIRPVTPELTCQDVLDILDETDTPEAPPWAPLHSSFENQQYDPTLKNLVGSTQTYDDSIRYEPILFPNRGDIVDAFGDYSKDLSMKNKVQDDTILNRFPPVEPLRPRMPLHKRKRQRAWVQRKKKRRHDHPENNTQEEREAALKLLEQINHTGVTLNDLLVLQRNARHWMHPEDEEDEAELLAAAVAAAKALKKAEVGELKRAKFEDIEEEDEDVEGFEVAGENDGPGENQLILGFVTKLGGEEEKKEDEDGDGAGYPPLKDDPEFSKYFKMIKMGLPNDVVKHALKRDGKDPSIMDLDHNKSLKSQRAPPKVESDDGPPLKDDEEYNKYFKMLKMGLPMDAVKHSVKRDGKDPTVMDLDPNKSLKSQRGGDGDDGPPLKEDPDYEKYFKMLKMGLPLDAVKHSVKRDGKDAAVMDLNPDKSLKSQQKSDDVDDGPPLKDDPEYGKYFKMLKMGLPMGAVKNAIQRDGKDPTMMDLDPEKSIKSQTGGGGGGEDAVDPGPPVKNDPDYEKYFKMMKMGLPMGAVKNAIERDGKDPTVMDLDPEKSIAFQRGGGGGAKEEELVDTGPPLRDDPDYSKYFKMLKMGLPMGAVKNAVERDGKDSSIMDLDQDKSIAFQLAKKKSPAGGGGGSARTAGVRKKAKKKVRRKKIYWTPIDPKRVVEGSLWSMVKGVVDMEKLAYDQSEFESLFTESTNPADKKKKEVKPGAASSSGKKKNVQVIDGKRSMNGGIILARLKLPYSKIAEMVNIMDSGDFDSTQLKALKDFLPNDEELGQLQGYLPPAGTSKEELASAMAALPECEKYMIAMFDVKNAPAKFDAMLFKVGFQTLLDELVEGINTLTKACNEVKNSERLRKMMAIILTLVNQINTGGDGNLALGFNLEALLKLGEAKAFDKKTSVLQYLVKLIRQNDDTLLDFKDDLKTLPQAVGVILDGLVGDMKVLNEQLLKVDATATEEADALEKDGKLPDMTAMLSSDDGKDEDTRPEAMKDDENGKMEVEKEEEKTDNGGIADDAKGGDTEENKGSSEDTDGNEEAEDAKLDGSPVPRTPMEVFTIKAKKDIDKALKTLSELQESYAGVLRYFGEDEKMASNDFFGTLQKFIKEFLKAADYVDKEERKKLKEMLKKAGKKAATMKLIGGSSANLDASPAKNGEASPTGKPDLGDLAAAAAAAAAKKNSAKQDRPDMGSIGAMAAAAAAQRKGKTKKSSKGEVGSSSGNEAAGPPNMGEIAAMAAAAAAKKAKKKDRPDMGGIAAMAAAAASKRKPVPEAASESVAGPPNTGGIAAMAAAAAAKRNRSTDEAPNPGGIAAMAAAAATKRKPATDVSNDGVAGPPNMGGIAAMAAAAAAKRNRSKEEAPNPDGISTMAAAAASKRKPANDNSNDGPRNMGGIAAMAAAAAVKRNQSKEKAPSPGGIAAMTAAAASKRNPATDVSNDGAAEPPNMGGIAAMAAAAAAKRNRSREEAPSPGGIAAMAAAAASKRQLKTVESREKDDLANVEQSSPAHSSGGGIAEMAAAAALKRNQSQQGAISSGGIAAMAAAAASKRQLKMASVENEVEAGDADARSLQAPNVGTLLTPQEKSESLETVTDSDTPKDADPAPPNGSGIAVMAAAAAAKRNRRRPDPVPPSGIAAMAAAAAAKRNQNRQGLPPPSGITAMAAAAASEGNLKKVERNVEEAPTTPIKTETPEQKEARSTDASIESSAMMHAEEGVAQSEALYFDRRVVSPSSFVTPEIELSNEAVMLGAIIIEHESGPETLIDDGSLCDEMNHMDGSGRDSLRRMLDNAPSRELTGSLLTDVFVEENEHMVSDSHLDTKEVLHEMQNDGNRLKATINQLAPDTEEAGFTHEREPTVGASSTDERHMLVEDDAVLDIGTKSKSPTSEVEGVDSDDDEIPEDIIDLVNATKKYFAGISSEPSHAVEGAHHSAHETVSSHQIEEKAKTMAKKRSSSFDDMHGDDDNSSAGESTSSKKQKPAPESDGDNEDLHFRRETAAAMDLDDEIVQSIERVHDGSMEFDVLEEGNKDEEDVFLDSVHEEIEGFLNAIVKADGPSDDDTKSKESFTTAESKLVPRSETDSADEISLQSVLKKQKSLKKKKKKKKKSSRRKITRQEANFDDIGITAADGIENADKAGNPEQQEQQQQLEQFFKESDGADTPLKSNLKMARRDSTTHPTQESSNGSDDDEKSQRQPREEKENREDEQNDSGNPFQRWMSTLGGSTRGLDAEIVDKAPDSPPKASTHSRQDSTGQSSSTHSKDSSSGFQKFFRQLSGRDQSVSSLPIESPGGTAKSAPSSKNNNESTSSQHSNPFSSFMQSLTMSPLDSDMIVKQAIEQEALEGMGIPSLSHDTSQGLKDCGEKPKSKEELEAEAL